MSLKLYEVCFGCGARRKVDLEPIWQHHVVFRGVSDPMAFCGDCGPTIHENTVDQEDLVTMHDLEVACGRRPWLADHSDKLMLEDAARNWTENDGVRVALDASGVGPTGKPRKLIRGNP